MHQLRRLRAGVPEHRHLPGWGRVAGARRVDACGDLHRHLLHRPREVHRVRRLLRPGGVRQGLPGRLLRARPRAAGERGGAARACPRAPSRQDDPRRRALALQEGGRRRARRARDQRPRRGGSGPRRRRSGAGSEARGAARVELFSLGVHKWIFLGLALAFAEAAFRMRESLFGGVPFGEAPIRGALYAPLMWPLGRLVVLLAGARGSASGVGFDGFYGDRDHFDEKLERDRRYGSIYKVVDRDDAYILRLEFPRRLPPSSLADELRLPLEMPDYDYELSLQDGTFVVHGRVTDPQVRKLTAVAPAFPPEFTTRVPLRDPVAGFRHRYRDKTLEVILPKTGS